MTVDPTAPLEGDVTDPKPAEEQTRLLDLGNGEWVRLRVPMTIDQLEAFSEAEINIAPAIRELKKAVVEAHFNNGKAVGEQPVTPTLANVLTKWNTTEDEVALPPANGQPSAARS